VIQPTIAYDGPQLVDSNIYLTFNSTIFVTMDDDAAFITRLKGFGLSEKEAVVYLPSSNMAQRPLLL